MKIERLFGIMEVCVNRRFDMLTRAISGSRASSCKEFRDFSVHVRTTALNVFGEMTKGEYGSLTITPNMRPQKKRVTIPGIAVRKPARLPAAYIAQRTPRKK